MVTQDSELRTHGPTLVSHGPVDAPAVLVLDPWGAACHGELPGSWRPLSEHILVAWYRLSVLDKSLPPARDVLRELAAGGRRVHVVSTGDAAELALVLAAAHPDWVGSVLLLDPVAAQADVLPGDPSWVTEETWAHRTSWLRDRLVDHGIMIVRLGGVGLEPSTPLGHPDVVRQVVEHVDLLEAHDRSAQRDMVEPG